MTGSSDLKSFFKSKEYKMILAADAEPRISSLDHGKIITSNPAGGVAVALDSIAQATSAIYIARAKSRDERKTVDENGVINIKGRNGEYKLKRLFFEEKEVENYYSGFSNQALWPLCHVAFEEPRWTNAWYESYKKINQAYADAINDSIVPGEKTFIWINDYQLALVPQFLERPENTVVAMFWHIPWPTWEIFRILPYKKEILKSLLMTDFLAFHRGYQMRNFAQTVDRELQSRTDTETQTVYFGKNATSIRNLPMGIDTDAVVSMIEPDEDENVLHKAVKETLNLEDGHPIDWYFEKYKVIFGIDRLDYTKGLLHRLDALEKFFEDPAYQEKAIYLGVMAPSREDIPSYKRLKKKVFDKAEEINQRFQTKNWKPIHLIYQVFNRKEVVNFYNRADACVITPLDDGMNLVAKEFVVASSISKNPGMLVLSQFTGSSIDLTSALIVNPYDTEQVTNSIKDALEMPIEEKIRRIGEMKQQLEENNIYEWGLQFIKGAPITRTSTT